MGPNSTRIIGPGWARFGRGLPRSVAPNSNMATAALRKRWIMKNTTLVVATTHNQRLCPAFFQPVSSACLTGACFTAAAAS